MTRKIKGVKKKVERNPQKRKFDLKEIPIDSVSPHPKNPRVHNDENIEAIGKSLTAFGQMTPIVVWKSKIIKGCGTWKAMRRLGWEMCQAVQADSLDESEAIAYCLADNKVGDLSDFDFKGVSELMDFLNESGYGTEATGFEDFEVQPLLDADWDKKKPSPEEKIGKEVKENRNVSVSFSLDLWDRVVKVLEWAYERGHIQTKDSDSLAIVKALEAERQFKKKAKRKKS